MGEGHGLVVEMPDRLPPASAALPCVVFPTGQHPNHAEGSSFGHSWTFCWIWSSSAGVVAAGSRPVVSCCYLPLLYMSRMTGVPSDCWIDRLLSAAALPSKF